MKGPLTDLPAIQAPALAGVRHAFFTREGGVSEGVYATLNGGVGSRDAPDAVGGEPPPHGATAGGRHPARALPGPLGRLPRRGGTLDRAAPAPTPSPRGRRDWRWASPAPTAA